ncbi:MAG: carboxypeptidase-like regulatory domain-containing protein [Chitinispirillales bacterium]|jgi:hypothetical protein|nr:carboxypeptidase-like regulatory domain-containing protein [Chitinispirillales bacterium]
MNRSTGFMSKKALVAAMLTVVSAFVLLISCGDNVVENFNNRPDIATEATLNVVVRDAITGDIVDGATVTLLTAPSGEVKNVVSSHTGTVTFRNIHVGTQSVLVEADGFASVLAVTDITRSPEATQENVFIAHDNTVVVYIRPLTASLDGYLYFNEDGSSKVAEGATVRLSISSGTNIVDRIFETTVASDGRYVFNNLPNLGSGDYSLTALDYTVGDVTYRNRPIANEGRGLQPGITTHLTQKTEYVETTLPFILLARPSFVEPDGPITLEFSNEIDVDRIAVNPVTVIPSQPITITYSGNTLTIAPFEHWRENGGAVTIRISNKLMSTGGTAFSGDDIDVDVMAEDLSNAAVVGLTLDSMHVVGDHNSATAIPQAISNEAKLFWNKLPGATDYTVYFKRDGFDFYEPTNVVNVRDTFAFVLINAHSNIGTNVNNFVVQASNGRSRSSLSGATTLDIFSRPTLGNTNKAPGDTVLDFTAELANELTPPLQMGVAFSKQIFIHFSEDMDRTIMGTGVISGDPSGLVNRITVAHHWASNAAGTPSDRILRLTINVAAGTPMTSNADNINRVYTISGLKSANGKDFFVEYTEPNLPGEVVNRGVEKIIRNTVDIRLETSANIL